MKIKTMSFKQFNGIEELKLYVEMWGVINEENVIILENGDENKKHWLTISKKPDKKTKEIEYKVTSIFGGTIFKDLDEFIDRSIDLMDRYEKSTSTQKQETLTNIRVKEIKMFNNVWELMVYMQEEKEQIFYEDIIILRNSDISDYTRLRITRNNDVIIDNDKNNKNSDEAYIYFDQNDIKHFSKLADFLQSVEHYTK